MFESAKKAIGVRMTSEMTYDMVFRKDVYGRHGTLLKVKPFFGEDPRPANPERMLQVLNDIDDRMSFEIWRDEGMISFHFWAREDSDAGLVKSQVAAQYPRADISVREDRWFPLIEDGNYVSCLNMRMTCLQYYPFETKFNADPLASILGTLSYFKESERALIQVVLSPSKYNWCSGADTVIMNYTNGRSVGWINPTVRQATESEKAMANLIGEKKSKSAFNIDIRIMTYSDDLFNATSKAAELAKDFSHYNMPGGNKFTYHFVKEKELIEFITDMSWRRSTILPLIIGRKKRAMTTMELSNIIHLPKTEIEIQDIEWSHIQPRMSPIIREEHMQNGKENGLVVCESNYRDRKNKVYLTDEDMDTHLAIFGRTGFGKSTLIARMALQKINEGESVIVIDPHGDLIREIVPRIDAKRIKDVILVEPLKHPIRLNAIEIPNRKSMSKEEISTMRDIVISDVVSTIKNVFYKDKPEYWGPRLDHIFSMTAKGLLEKEGTNLVDMYFILTDRQVRKKFAQEINDPIIDNFINNEFPQRKFEDLDTTVTKVSKFSVNEILRKNLCQRYDTFNIKSALDGKKVLLFDLSKGKLGTENTNALGSAVVTQIWLNVLQRAKIPESSRTRTYLFVDEFQNFASQSFNEILSEARKYKLSLVLATQYTKQIGDDMWNGIAGNISTMVSFALGSDDARRLSLVYVDAKPEEFIQLDKFNVIIRKGNRTTQGMTIALDEEKDMCNFDKASGWDDGKQMDDSLISSFIDAHNEILRFLTALSKLDNSKDREMFSRFEIERELDKMNCPISKFMLDNALAECTTRNYIMNVWTGRTNEYKILQDGLKAIDSLMGSTTTAGGVEHRELVHDMFDCYSTKGCSIEIVLQGGACPLPDLKFEAGEYLMELSGGRKINGECEVSTTTKPSRILEDVVKAKEDDRLCLFGAKDSTVAKKIYETLKNPYKRKKNGIDECYSINGDEKFDPLEKFNGPIQPRDWKIVVRTEKKEFVEYTHKSENKSLDDQPDDIDTEDEETEENNGTIIGNIERDLKENPGLHTPDEISENHGISYDHACSALSKLWKKGRLRRPEEGKYVHIDIVVEPGGY